MAMTDAEFQAIDSIEQRLNDQRAVAQMVGAVAVVYRLAGDDAGNYADTLIEGIQVVSEHIAKELNAIRTDLLALAKGGAK